MEALYYFDPVNPELRSNGTKLLYIKGADSSDDWHSTLHEHPFAEFFYVTRGEGAMLTPRGRMELRQGDLVVVNAHLLHSEARLEGRHFAYIVVGVDGLSLFKKPDDILAENASRNIYEAFSESGIIRQSCAANYEKFGALFEELLREATRRKPLYSLYCHTLMDLIVLNLVRLGTQNLVLSDNTPAGAQLERVKQFLDSHYSREIRLDDLAEMGYLNKYDLIRRFKKVFGLTPMQYLRQKRIGVADNLLTTTDYTLEEIARIAGFGSASYLSQCFRKDLGCTPGDRRRTRRSEKQP